MLDYTVVSYLKKNVIDMLKNDLDKILLPWTEQEHICKEYLERKNDPDYMRTFDKKRCYDLLLSLPGITDDMPRPTIIYDFFEDDIYINRHGRYDIPFKHRHTFYEMLFVYEGKAVNTVAGKEHIIFENELMVVPPNVEHSLFTTGVVVNIIVKKSYIKNNFFTLFSYDNAFTNFFFNSVFSKDQYEYLTIDISSNCIRDLIYILISEGLNELNKNSAIKNSLLQTIFLMTGKEYGKNIELPDDLAPTNRLVVEIVHYISSNYVHVTLEEVASKFNYSVSYLSKIISSCMNMTFKEILYKIKIENALKLLSSTDESIEKISEKIGYINTASFYRAFKNTMGMTPGEYRENCKKTQYIFKVNKKND